VVKDEKKTKKELIEELQYLRKRLSELEAGQIKDTMRNEKNLDQLRGNETILVVDDNDLFRKFIVHTLNLLGYHTFEAESSKKAIEIIEKKHSHIDLMLTDIVMPDMSGRELAEHLKTFRPKIKMIFMSGYAEDIVVHREVFTIIDKGSSFLKKPFSPFELAEKIKHKLTEA